MAVLLWFCGVWRVKRIFAAFGNSVLSWPRKAYKSLQCNGGKYEKGYGAFVSAGAAVVFAVFGGGGA